MYSLFMMEEVTANKALSHHEIIYPVHKSKKKKTGLHKRRLSLTSSFLPSP